VTAVTTPHRIVSLISSATEILYGLGLGDRLVAVSHECDWPAAAASLPQATFSNIDSAAASGQIDDQVKQQLTAGEPLYEIDRELLESLAPDLIVTQAQCDVCAVKYDDVAELVQTSPALAETRIVSLAPEMLDEVLSDIRRVGEAAGVQAAAEDYLQQLERRLRDVQQTVAQAARVDRPRVAIIEWLEPMMIAGNWTPGLVDRAGGKYDLAVEGRHSEYVDWSKLASYDPEVLVIAPCGFDIERTLRETDTLTARSEWRQLSAVRSGRVFVMDGNAYLNRSGPRLVDTAEILSHLIHPGLCGPPAAVGDSAQAWRPFV